MLKNFESMQEKEIFELLVNINKKTIKWSTLLYGKKTSKFLFELWANKNNSSSIIPENLQEEWQKDFEEIKLVFDLEPIMFEKFKKFIVYAVKKTANKRKSYYMHSDFVNEAYIIFKKCLWFYSNTEIKFTTYLFRAINLRIKQISYTQKNSKLNLNFQSETLDVVKNNSTEEVSDIVEVKNLNIDQMLNDCNLNENEKTAIKLKFTYDHKWIREGKKLILKNNGKAYCNYALRLILQRAMTKIKIKYKVENISLAS